LDVRLQDWRSASRESLGPFDAIASVGAFEHFCSEEEFLAGRQSEVYRRFFRLCRSLLPAGGRLYLQTMIWGKNRPPNAAARLDAPRGSDRYILACLRLFYPGSWLPENLGQIRDAAGGLFCLQSNKNGRADYAYTMAAWGAQLRRLNRPKVAAIARLLWRYPRRDPAFFRKAETLLFDYNAEVFRRHLFDHERLVFEAV
jgi:cyclopropane-fatty-acyl-phospholipid synthase